MTRREGLKRAVKADGLVWPQVFSCLVIVLLLGMTPAVQAISVRSVQAVPRAREAVITWQTDVLGNSFVNYTDGNTSQILKDMSYTDDHSISITGLEPKKRYEYQVVSVGLDVPEKAKSDWLSFTTTPELSQELFFNADIPAYTNGQPVTIEGTTNKEAHVIVYVDGLPAATEYADTNGSISVRNVRMARGRNVSHVMIEVQHPATDNILQKNYTLRLDRKAPTIHINPIQTTSTTGTVQIEGSVSEYVRIEIFTKNDDDEVEDQFNQEVNDTFSASLHLNDGRNLIKMFATDAAGNEVSLTRTVFVDTEPPTILKHNIHDLDPAYSPSVTIEGQVSEPNIPVRIYVNPDDTKNGIHVCSDGLDNDGDGLTDYLHDPGCESPDDVSEIDLGLNTACSDGKDNDNDGRIDFLDDPGCDSESDNSEEDYNATVTECNDGVDNDMDGKVDYLEDEGCSSLKDQSEDSENENVDYYETYADEEGHFSKDVTLSHALSLRNLKLSESVEVLRDKDVAGMDDYQKSDGEWAGEAAYDTAGAPGDEDSARNLIRIVAIDKVGQRDTVEGEIRYATCGKGGEWNIVMGEVYPGIIQPDLLFEGAAQITFTLDLQYFGTGEEAYVSAVSMSSRDLSVADNKDFAPSQVLNPSSGCRIYPEGRVDNKAYVVCNLNKYPPERLRDENEAYEKLEDMESFVFPLKLQLDYEYVNAYGERKSKFQENCFDIELFIDRRLPPDKIPEGLLEGSVNALNKTIDAIDTVLKPLRTITLATAGACLATHLGLFFQTASLEYACLGMQQNELPALEQALRGAEDGEEDTAIATVCEKGGKDGDDQNPLGTTCNGCAEAVKQVIKLQKFYAGVCDRIMCPSTPTAQKYIEDINRNDASARTSACDTVGGQRNPYIQTAQHAIETNDEFTKEKGCGKEYYDQWSTSCLAYSVGGDNIVEASKNLGRDENESKRFGLQGMLNRLNNLDFCKVAEDKNNRSFTYGGSAYIYDEEQGCHVMGDDPYYQLVKQSGSFMDNSHVQDNRANIGVHKYDSQTEEMFSERGLTKCVRLDDRGDLYYVPVDERTGNPVQFDVQRTDRMMTRLAPPDGRQTVRVQHVGSVERSDDTYYTFVDQNNRLYSVKDADGLGVEGTLDKLQSGTNLDDPPRMAGYQGYEHVMKGRDSSKLAYKPASAVENLDEKQRTAHGYSRVRGPEALRQDKVPDVLIDSKSSFINSVRCVCLPAISGYLQQIRSILSAIRNCLQGVLLTKSFKSGMCKAVLTQYLCDWIFEAIGCFVKAAGMSDPQMKGEAQRGSLSELQKVFTAVGRAGKSVNTYAANRYGETGTFNALFTQRKLIHAVCLAAFGYDWIPDLEATINMGSEGFALNSSGMVYPATRRFMSANPMRQGEATFVYHVGYFLAAGADVNYQLELICSRDNSCNADEGFEAGRCDCSWGAGVAPQYPQNIASDMQTPQNNVYGYAPTGPAGGGNLLAGRSYILDSGFLKAGESTSGEGEVYRKVIDTVRYDKARLSWTPTASGGEPGEAIIDIRSVGDKPPLQCQFNMQLLQFACPFEIRQDGEVFFTEPPYIKDEKGIYAQGDKIEVAIPVKVMYPDNLPREEKNLKYAKLTLKNQYDQVVNTPLITNPFDLLQSGTVVLPAGKTKLSIGGSQEQYVASDLRSLSKISPLLKESELQNIYGGFEREMALDITLSTQNDEVVCDAQLQDLERRENEWHMVGNTRKIGCEYNRGRVRLTDATVVDGRMGFSVNSAFIKKLKDEKIGNGIFFYRKKQNGKSDIVCTDEDSEYVEWHAEVSLHHSVPKNPRRDYDWNNQRISTQVAVHNDKEQLEQIPIQIPCTPTDGSQEGDYCEFNRLLGKDCACGDARCTSKVDDDMLLLNTYCSGESVTCKEVDHVSAEVCSVINQEGKSSPGVVSEVCYCDAKGLKRGEAKKSQGMAVCDPGQVCWKYKDGRYGCTSKEKEEKKSEPKKDVLSSPASAEDNVEKEDADASDKKSVEEQARFFPKIATYYGEWNHTEGNMYKKGDETATFDPGQDSLSVINGDDQTVYSVYLDNATNVGYFRVSNSLGSIDNKCNWAEEISGDDIYGNPIGIFAYCLEQMQNGGIKAAYGEQNERVLVVLNSKYESQKYEIELVGVDDVLFSQHDDIFVVDPNNVVDVSIQSMELESYFAAEAT